MAGEIIISPLDAYETAKPNEPTWTVQGGDPLGAPLLRIWAHFARIQAGAIGPGLEGMFEQLLKAANANTPENDRERKELLLKATQTEFVSFDMDAYFKSGGTDADESKTAAENSPAAEERLDLHDRRVRAAQAINNMVAELTTIVEEFDNPDFNDLLQTQQSGVVWHQVKRDIENLRSLSAVMEPRRLFKKR